MVTLGESPWRSWGHPQGSRTIPLDGHPWFVAKDACAALGIAKTDRAVADLEASQKGAHTVRTPGGPQKMTIVSEGGLYALIMQSRKPAAIRFKLWVTDVVLPAVSIWPNVISSSCPRQDRVLTAVVAMDVATTTGPAPG